MLNYALCLTLVCYIYIVSEETCSCYSVYKLGQLSCFYFLFICVLGKYIFKYRCAVCVRMAQLQDSLCC